MSGYLRKMWKTFLLFLSFCGILGLTFWLYGCSLEPVFYGAALCMIPAAGAFLYGWNRFRKEKEQLERIKALLPLELETLPKPEDEREEPVSGQRAVPGRGICGNGSGIPEDRRYVFGYAV